MRYTWIWILALILGDLERNLPPHLENGDNDSDGTGGVSSVQSLSRVQLFATPWTAARQASCPSPAPRVHQVSEAIQPFHPVIPFSSHLQSFPASGSFPVSQFFTSGGQSIGVSALALVLKYLGLISFRTDWLDLLAVQWAGGLWELRWVNVNKLCLVY